MSASTEIDPLDGRRPARAPGLLGPFSDAGLLSAADVHVATRLADLAGENDETVRLAVALTVRAPRLGHVHVDLSQIRDSAAVELDEPADLSELPWPEPSRWRELVSASRLVADGEQELPEEEQAQPLRLVGDWLYLDRYWREERAVAADLAARAAEGLARDELAEDLPGILAALFERETSSRQCMAVAVSSLRRLSVVAGGPGTGKTTTVARIVAALLEGSRLANATEPLMALAAPTGRGAARLQEAVYAEVAELELPQETRDLLLGLKASTLHRLLGWRPGSATRFLHDRERQLPHDVVIVDESSMVSLSMMARLLEAIRPDARLVLVGDPDQLASIEAGAVLGDVVGPAADELLMTSSMRERLTAATGSKPDAAEPPPGSLIPDSVVVLDRVHRFGGQIAALAKAIKSGDADQTIEVLGGEGEGLRWIAVDAALDEPSGTEVVREAAVASARGVIESARDGASADAIAALDRFRLLCAHRRGDHGLASWVARIERWLEPEIGEPRGPEHWYEGKPLLITENDYELRLFNGDTGVVVAPAGGSENGGLRAAFDRGGEIIEISPTRLAAVETAYAMTIHKAQGSQFETAAVLLPDPSSRVLTRELFYTAATRARQELIVVGTAEMVRAAVERPIARASGLRWRLWGMAGRPD